MKYAVISIQSINAHSYNTDFYYFLERQNKN